MDSSAATLLELFPDAPYRHRMRFRQGTIAEFFGRAAGDSAILAERRRWLETNAASHAALLPEGVPLLEETVELLLAERALHSSIPSTMAASPWENLLTLGKCLEPDLLLLQRDESGVLRLRAGCVCFPSSWSLAEKIGHPLEFIHDVVPGLNAQLGQSVNSFLAKMQPGVAWLRANWGLSRTPELNQHLDRGLPKLDATVGLEEVWLRVEHQALVSLPRTGGVLFGIRLANHPLVEVKQDAELARRLCLALETMPEAMAQYKGLVPARHRLLELLG